MAARLIYSTWPDPDTAAACARSLIEARLAACVTILPNARSVYRWEGAIQDSAEAVMLAKTDAARAGALLEALNAAHPYDLPCILSLSLDTENCSAEFLQWVATETS